MASNKKDLHQLDPGFEEVPLDQGFQEVPLKSKSPTFSDELSRRVYNAAMSPAELVPSAESIKDFGMGLGQELTLGGGDEAVGAVRALIDKLNSEKPYTELYRQRQQEAEQALKEAQERSPYAYGAGQVAGIGAMAIGTGGLGTGATAGKLATKIPLLARALKAAPVTTRLATGAVEMAPIGAVQGALESEKGKLIGATPEEQEKLKADITGSAVTAGALGAGLHAASVLGEMGAGATKKALGKYIEESPALRQMGIAYKTGKEGLSYSSEKDITNKFLDLAPKTAENYLDKIAAVDKDLGQAVGKAINDATNAGLKIDITPDVMKTSQNLMDAWARNPAIADDPGARKMFDKLLSRNFEVTPDELRTARDYADNMLSKLQGDTSTLANQTRGAVLDFKNSIVSRLKESIPQYRDAANRFEEFRRLVPETILSKGRTPDISGIRYSDIKNPELKLSQSIEDMLSGATRPGTETDVAKRTMKRLGESLGTLEQSEAQRAAQATAQNQPFNSIFSKLGGNKEEIMSKMKQEADVISAANLGRSAKVQGEIKPSTQLLSSGLTAAKSLGVSGANIAGQVAKGAEELAKKPALLAQRVYKASPQQLQNIATKLSQNPKTQMLSNALSKALENKNSAARNAILFSILQDPDARLLIDAKDLENVESEQ